MMTMRFSWDWYGEKLTKTFLASLYHIANSFEGSGSVELFEEEYERLYYKTREKIETCFREALRDREELENLAREIAGGSECFLFGHCFKWECYPSPENVHFFEEDVIDIMRAYINIPPVERLNDEQITKFLDCFFLYLDYSPRDIWDRVKDDLVDILKDEIKSENVIDFLYEMQGFDDFIFDRGFRDCLENANLDLAYEYAERRKDEIEKCIEETSL